MRARPKELNTITIEIIYDSKMSREIILANMTWPEVEERLKETQIAIIATGSTEQHGHHMPLSTDYAIAWALATKAAEKVADDVGAVVVPVLPFGRTFFMEFPGTITLRPTTLMNLYVDVAKSLIHHGFNKIVFVNAHGGNRTVLDVATRYLKLKTWAWIATVGSGNFLPEGFTQNLWESPPAQHAGESEASMAMAAGLHVRMDKLMKVEPRWEEPAEYTFYPGGKVRTPLAGNRLPVKETTKTGGYGDSTKASREKGEKVLNKAVEGFAEFLRKLNKVEVKSKTVNVWDTEI